ncbi:hypothetical protein PPOP_1525 [Paenibacillus popilliae ATCC 14706]|uniref:Uncharacterized protein n=2 Tax=Paenibacillus popilliae TaxID=78057 RepID=M9M4I0_PAEPP|nr:hypothetical protein PPOP_1525 [Paenibacillus popilliae ATCC 14706]
MERANQYLKENKGREQQMDKRFGKWFRYLEEQSFDELKKSDLVADAYHVVTLDDSIYRFVLEFHKPVKYEVQEYADPAHIVLTLSQDKEAGKKTIYSVRTETYMNGEEIGIVEEGLYEESGIRTLKENGDQFYIELGSLTDEAEAILSGVCAGDRFFHPGDREKCVDKSGHCTIYNQQKPDAFLATDRKASGFSC